jgi:HD-GYP domain-containing protein (c-di-GMP phosphodiesterase class II)
MTIFTKSAVLSLVLLLSSGGSDAFTPAARFGVVSPSTPLAFRAPTTTRSLSTPPLHAVSSDQAPQLLIAANNEVEKLRAMAAKLRAEAASLEAEKADETAQAAQKAFKKFDTNQDGEITLEELKAGLEKNFKMDVPEARLQKLMETFDSSGDGALQLEEFVGVNKFRNQLDQISRQEKETDKLAQQEAKAAKQAEATLAIINESINDRAPTNTDKLLSVLPLLLPLLDSVQSGGHLLSTHQDNPLVLGLAILFQLYRSVPFSAFIAFFALSAVGNNLSANRLIRFNANQAIFLDVAMFLPGLLASLVALIAGGSGVQIPQGIAELGQDAVFVTTLLAIGYSAVSSLLGVTPDKIPFISDAVSQRMPSIDMFDTQGRFIPRQPDEKENKNDE